MAFALGDVPDGSVVLAVVLVNALIGFAQEYRAGKAIQALARLVSEPATVRRDRRWTGTGAEALVPGDVVSLAAGARVAADLRIVQARGLRADEAALTGESVPVDKTADPVDAATELGGRRSLLHGGTLVTAGAAEAVVVATGDRTELGRISGLLGSIEPTQTPLTRSIARLGCDVPADAAGGSPDLARAQTLAVTSVAFFQIFYLLVCRTLTAPLHSIGWTSNPYVFAGIGLLLVLQVGFVHLPVMQILFRTADLTGAEWLLAAAAGATVIPVVSAEKAWRRARAAWPRSRAWADAPKVLRHS